MDEIREQDIENYTVAMLVSAETIAALYSEDDEGRRAALEVLLKHRAKELGIERDYKKVLEAYNKVEKQLADEYTREHALNKQNIPLAIDGRGRPMITIDNFFMVMKHDDKYKNIRFNQLKNAPEITEGGEIKRYSDADASESRRYIEKKYHIHSKDKHRDALAVLFDHRKYHPVRALIESVKWDGVERIPTMLAKWMKCEDNQYTRETSRLIFAGGINRIYQPGCKFDDMVVLIGTEQGEGKSTFVRWLAIDENFYRTIDTIDGQRGMEAVEGAWVCEIEELLALTKIKEREAVKAFLSKQVDVYRKPYGEYVNETPRQCIFIGTTNRREFLIDDKNRRFYPVVCNSSGYQLYDAEKEIRADILQCWAEAKFKYDQNDMLPYADQRLLPEIRVQQELAKEDDWRIGAIEKYLSTKPIGYLVCRREIKRVALAENPDFPKDPTPKESQEIGVMMKEMTEWENVGLRYTENFGRQRCWERVRNEEAEKQAEVTDDF